VDAAKVVVHEVQGARVLVIFNLLEWPFVRRVKRRIPSYTLQMLACGRRRIFCPAGFAKSDLNLFNEISSLISRIVRYFARKKNFPPSCLRMKGENRPVTQSDRAPRRLSGPTNRLLKKPSFLLASRFGRLDFG
jgi:hypothetical protein